MSPTTLRRAAVAAVIILPVAGCTPGASVASPSLSVAPARSTTLLVRLGTDTVAIEQYTRTPTRMDGVLVSRSPFTTIARYSVDVGAANAPVRAEYSLRRGDGSVAVGAMQSLSVRYGTDSVTFIGHRANGDTTRTAVARGEVLPFVNGSYGLFELALAKLLGSGRDSAQFAIVPLNFGVRGTSPLPVRLIGRDSARITWFGDPLYARHDGRGGLLGLDGSRTTIKVRVDRVAATDLDTLARTWAARDQVAGPAGPASTRDTVTATLGGAHVWIDYGRPALRGRSVWARGVLGDTLWRTGANAATQLRTDADLAIGGTTVPAGTYSLWTYAARGGYQLVVNRQSGQWGTEYHADRDLARIPLREEVASTPAERFTIAVVPQGASGGLLTMTWGAKQLSVPVAAK
jgi:hypothetical protein